MTYPLPTASSLERVLACPASHVLPQVRTTGEAAERGSAIGRYVRDILAGEDADIAIARVPQAKWKATCLGLDWEAICGDLVLETVRAEVAYGWGFAVSQDSDAPNARELGVNLGRRYPKLLPDEYAGTNDLEGRAKAGGEVVCDLKSGLDVTACGANPQMRFHALARHVVTGKPVEARVLQIRESGRVDVDAHLFTSLELDSFADELTELVVRIDAARSVYLAGGQPDVNAGSHCRYCPGKWSCPAFTLPARSALPAPSTGPLSDDEAMTAWQKIREVKAWAVEAEARMKDLARSRPFPVRWGKELREITFTRETFSSDRAQDVIRALGGTSEQVRSCFVEATVGQVREVNGHGE